MDTVTERTQISQTPDVLWNDIGRFGSVGAWHPMLAKVESEGEHEGSLRMAEGKDGSKQIERLIEGAPEQHFYRYQMESSPMPVRNYTAEFRIENARTALASLSGRRSLKRRRMTRRLLRPFVPLLKQVLKISRTCTETNDKMRRW